MKIIKLQAENVKKLRCVEIVPTGAIVQITGPNGSGKSSVLDAIFYALAGQRAIDSKPVRDGTETATITLDLGEFTVVRTFKAEGGRTTKLEVLTPEGAKFPSPQKVLDALLGSLTFDPLAFARSAPKEQLDQLKGLVPLDINLDELDAENRRDFAARTDINRIAKDLEAQLRGFGDVETVDPPITVSALLAELDAAVEMNRQTDTEARRRSDHHQLITSAEKRQARLMDELAEAEATILSLKAERAAWPEEAKPVDISALRERIDAATEAQRAYDIAQRRQTERDQLAMKLDHARHDKRRVHLTTMDSAHRAAHAGDRGGEDAGRRAGVRGWRGERRRAAVRAGVGRRAVARLRGDRHGGESEAPRAADHGRLTVGLEVARAPHGDGRVARLPVLHRMRR